MGAIMFLDMVFRTADLLERADDKDAMKFENEVMILATAYDQGSDRSTKAHAILGSEDDVLLRPHLDSVEIP